MTTDILFEIARSALPRSRQKDAASLCFAFLEILPPALGVSLLRHVIDSLPVEAWVAQSARASNAWPLTTRNALQEANENLEPGRWRIEGLCSLAPWISDALRQEAFAGILDETSPVYFWGDGSGVMGNEELHNRLIKTLSDEEKEGWIVRCQGSLRRAPTASTEAHFRADIEHWPENAAHRLWFEMHAESASYGLNLWTLHYLLPHLSPSLHKEALELVRRSEEGKYRAHHLAIFDEELTLEEHTSVVFDPDPPSSGNDRSRDRKHIRYLSQSTRLAWLDRIEKDHINHARFYGLTWMVPFLEGGAQERGIAEITEIALQPDAWATLGDVCALLSLERIEQLLSHALRLPDVRWSAGELLHEIARRGPTTERRFLPLVLDALRRQENPDDQLVLLELLAGWSCVRAEDGLARRMASAIERGALELPTTSESAAGTR